MNSDPQNMEEVLVNEASLAAAHQTRDAMAAGKRGGNNRLLVSLKELLQTKYRRENVILDCEGCDAEAKKRLERGGGVPAGHFTGAPSAGCELQILIPPDGATISASRDATASEEPSVANGKQNKKQQGKMNNDDAPKKCPKRDVPSQNPNANWIVLENLIAERLGVAWAEFRYVPQFSQPSLIGPSEPMGQTAENILEFQVRASTNIRISIPKTEFQPCRVLLWIRLLRLSKSLGSDRLERQSTATRTFMPTPTCKLTCRKVWSSK